MLENLSPSKDAAVPTPAPHPDHLRRIDRAYIVAWGYTELAKLLGLCAVLLAGVVAVTAAVGEPWLLLLSLPVAAFAVWGALFFRNPKRSPPPGAASLVAAADGRVVEVTEVFEGEYLGAPALKVSVFLSVFDVHVNRSPGDASVAYLRYRPGRFHDARDRRSILENESQTIGCRLTATGDRILVRQISGAVARRIICPLRHGDPIARAGLIGMIKFGSRTEMYVPQTSSSDGAAWGVRVGVGERVVGGETVVFARAPHHAAAAEV